MCNKQHRLYTNWVTVYRNTELAYPLVPVHKFLLKLFVSTLTAFGGSPAAKCKHVIVYTVHNTPARVKDIYAQTYVTRVFAGFHLHEMMQFHTDNSMSCLLALPPLLRFISIGLRANSGLTCAIPPCMYVCRCRFDRYVHTSTSTSTYVGAGICQ